jgi:Leucine-rich repeat (LRR) protein
MSGSPSNLPVIRHAGSQPDVIRSTRALVSRVACEAAANLSSLNEKLYLIGDYKVDEQSYQQIMIWLEQINSTGKNIALNTLINHFEIWACGEKWVQEKKIFRAMLRDWDMEHLNLSLVPSLTSLNCVSNRLKELDLSKVTNLTELACAGNQLTELDLSLVPSLTSLHCLSNRLKELDLSQVTNLTDLSCGENQLTKLDLWHVPSLTNLSCSGNQLTDLDLSCMLSLEQLYCCDNNLRELDLSYTANLHSVDCENNHLTELDLSNVPDLEYLFCSGNQITELDIRNCKFTHFELNCDPHVIIHKRSDQIVKHP